MEIHQVRFSDLTIKEGRNPRFDYGDVEGLAASILQHGLLQPLRVRKGPDGFELVDGHRRFRALEELARSGQGLAQVPVIVEDEEADESHLLIKVLASNHGKPLLPIEEAIAFKRLLEEFELSINAISVSVGKSFSHVKGRLALLDAEPEVREALAEGSVGVTLATEIASQEDPEVQKQLIREAKEKPERARKKLSPVPSDKENLRLLVRAVNLAMEEQYGQRWMDRNDFPSTSQTRLAELVRKLRS